MSFLGGRVAVSESKFFREESEAKASDLRKKQQQQQQQAVPTGTSSKAALPPAASNPARAAPAAAAAAASGAQGLSDVLPEVLMNDLPLRLRQASPPTSLGEEGPAGFSAADAGARPKGGPQVQPRLGSLSRNLVAVPETRLGPAKYQLSFPPSPSSLHNSTANERRQLQAVSEAAIKNSAQTAAATRDALFMVSKAFGVATLLVYGGAAVGVGLGMRAMGITKLEDIPEKGKALLEPRIAAIRGSFEPLKDRMNAAAQRWRMSEDQQKAVGQKYAEVLKVPESSGGNGVH